MDIFLGVLDLVPVSSGSTAPEALRNSIDLARAAERLGYARHWYAEHHLNPGVAGTSPAVVLALTAADASTIRLGSGAVLLGHRTALSRFVGGMIMGLGTALTEGSTLDTAFGGFTESDLAAYHVPVHADVLRIETHRTDEEDAHLDPVGSKGIGGTGIVGTAAAIGNAVRHATGVRFRGLPLTPDKMPTAPAG
ncbi:hypothetical protein GCM10027162_47620 [Streptomyces incanus]